MDILQNILASIKDQPELTFLVISNFMLLGIVMYIAIKRPNKYIKIFAAILLMFSMVLSVPVFFRMFFK